MAVKKTGGERPVVEIAFLGKDWRGKHLIGKYRKGKGRQGKYRSPDNHL